jgi:hypothetical protein
MSPVAVARNAHHLPGLAVDWQRDGARKAAFGIKADGAHRKRGGCRLAGEQLPGRRGASFWLAERRQRLGIEGALVLRVCCAVHEK